jgi:hypothetical protein
MHAPDLSQVYARKATFVICQDCFWCASCFRVNDSFLRCPLCRNDSIDSLPIFGDEYYRVELSVNKNVELWFAAGYVAGSQDFEK